jgi:hypothetical protein
MPKIIALPQHRLALLAGQRIGEAVAEVQPGQVAADGRLFDRVVEEGSWAMARINPAERPARVNQWVSRIRIAGKITLSARPSRNRSRAGSLRGYVESRPSRNNQGCGEDEAPGA